MTSTELYSIPVELPDGTETTLEEHRGKVLLVVNVASKCGFTPQYDGLEALQKDFGDRGFSVLAFPCNQFGMQEPGSNDEIVEFCRTKFDVTFPVYAKIKVNGSDAHPLYQHLKSQQKGVLGTQGIKWNFTKFLIDTDGQVVERYGSQTEPAKIRDAIDSRLSD